MNPLLSVATAELAIQNDRLERELARPWTFCGIQRFPGCMVMFLVNGADRSTRALVAYDELHPVAIRELP